MLSNDHGRGEKTILDYMGPREFVRLSLAFLLWNAAGVVLGIGLSYSAAFLVFFVTSIVFLLATPWWRPAYRVFRWIIGNNNLPENPFILKPRWDPTQRLSVSLVVILLWVVIMGIALVYLMLRHEGL